MGKHFTNISSQDLAQLVRDTKCSLQGASVSEFKSSLGRKKKTQIVNTWAGRALVRLCSPSLSWLKRSPTTSFWWISSISAALLPRLQTKASNCNSKFQQHIQGKVMITFDKIIIILVLSHQSGFHKILAWFFLENIHIQSWIDLKIIEKPW